MPKVSVANRQPDELFAEAQKALQAADVPKALDLFRAVLALDPQHGMANYWLGVLVKPLAAERAIPHLALAAARHPEIADCHIELGLTYRSLGLTEEAEASFRRARELTPVYGEAQLSIAEALVEQKRWEEAVEACQRGLLLFPHDPALLRKLADVFVRLKRWREALIVWRQLLELKPQCEATHYAFAEACVDANELELAATAFGRVLELNARSFPARLNLGVVLEKMGRFEAALECFESCLASVPRSPKLRKALGDVYGKLNRWNEAEREWRLAIEIQPDYADAWQNLGLGLERMNRLQEAFECHQRVVSYKATDPTAHRYLGMISQDLGRFELARQHYAEALRLAPSDPEVHWQLFSLKATVGEFPDAWLEHEWRWEIHNRTTPKHGFPKPRWQGEDLAGRTILLHAEQGFGDTIQAIRYIPQVLQRGGEVLLWAPPQLVPLLRPLPGVKEVFSQLTPDKQYDVELPLMSLPKVFETTLATIPAKCPYLFTPSDVPFELPVFDSESLKVGIVWCGSRSQPNDRRPVPFPALEPLLTLRGVAFYSLQCGDAADDLHRHPVGARVIDLSLSLVDFALTAAALDQLDLVITVDTAMAHLAGAMGRPVWTLLSATPDWRWMRERDDSPWYPTMRLFRQAEAGSWGPVIERVGRALQGWVANKMLTVPLRIWLGKGLAHHQRDELAEARWCYEQVLRQDPRQADALRLLGEICLQSGDWEGAESWLGQALSVLPDSPHVYNSLGLVCFEKGRFDEAIKCYRQAVQLDSEMVEAHYNLGNACYRSGQLSVAQSAYLRALELRADFPDAHYNLGLIAQEEGDRNRAQAHYEATLKLNASHVGAWQNLGLIHKDAQAFAAAEECFRHVLEVRAEDLEARVNLASVLIATHRLEQAVSLCEEGIHRDPGLAEAWMNLGVAQQALGRVGDALGSFRRALDLQPRNADAEYNLGIAELLAGDWANGWKHYEARWRTANPIFARQFPARLWNREELAGRTIMIHAEQGYGDTIQFARYLPLLARAGAKVLLESPQPLVRLMMTVEGVISVIPAGDPWPVCDFRCPLLSLPERFGTNLANIPNSVPYFKVDRRWLKLGPGESRSDRRHRIGIVWFGSRNQPQDRRPIPFELVQALFSLDNAEFCSLQIGAMPEELQGALASARIEQYGDQLVDFAATAALIDQLDLIISVDTATAHLAGALGRPVWLLLPFAPDWRWLRDREDSPWYPSMRLFRQPAPGAWAPVIDRVVAELRAHGKSQ